VTFFNQCDLFCKQLFYARYNIVLYLLIIIICNVDKQIIYIYQSGKGI